MMPTRDYMNAPRQAAVPGRLRRLVSLASSRSGISRVRNTIAAMLAPHGVSAHNVVRVDRRRRNRSQEIDRGIRAWNVGVYGVSWGPSRAPSALPPVGCG